MVCPCPLFFQNDQVNVAVYKHLIGFISFLHFKHNNRVTIHNYFLSVTKRHQPSLEFAWFCVPSLIFIEASDVRIHYLNHCASLRIAPFYQKNTIRSNATQPSCHKSNPPSRVVEITVLLSFSWDSQNKKVIQLNWTLTHPRDGKVTWWKMKHNLWKDFNTTSRSLWM